MPSWHSLLNESRIRGSTYDILRREYLRKLNRVTKRNIIAYYSGWLQKPGLAGIHVNDADKNGFMTVIHKLDRSKGLDLILHTPGGDTAATESLVDYLRSMFETDIRVIVPQLAMSAGTMIACAAKEIVMGSHSSLGPIDPQYNGRPAHGVLEEFSRAFEEMKADQSKAFVWQPILQKYNPTLVGECEKAVAWSNEMSVEWLISGMFKGEIGATKKAKEVVKELGDHAVTKSHARHLSLKRCQEIGLKVAALEDDQPLQEAVLSVHHAFVLTLSQTAAFKIVENHKGIAMISVAQQVMIQGPMQGQQIPGGQE